MTVLDGKNKYEPKYMNIEFIYSKYEQTISDYFLTSAKHRIIVILGFLEIVFFFK